jgi:hypothetical protein
MTQMKNYSIAAITTATATSPISYMGKSRRLLQVGFRRNGGGFTVPMIDYWVNSNYKTNITVNTRTICHQATNFSSQYSIISNKS